MTELSDTQAVIRRAASQCDDGVVLPLTGRSPAGNKVRNRRLGTDSARRSAAMMPFG